MNDDSTTRLMRFEANKKSILAAYLIWFFLGGFGIHRMYFGRWISGIILLVLTLAGLALSVVFIGYLPLAVAGLWWLLDALLIPGMVTASNNELIDSMSR
ncbi:MAG: TM2 domain-containing protein [Ferrovibrionaceae bacterium]